MRAIAREQESQQLFFILGTQPWNRRHRAAPFRDERENFLITHPVSEAQ